MDTTQPVAGSSSDNQSAITWYAYGQALPAGKFGADFERMTFEHLKKSMPNLVPTTYDASRAYLDEERRKPEGEGDLLREMCMMMPLGLAKDLKVYFIASATKLLIPLHSGSMMLFPTTDLPPDSFGSPEDWGFLGGNMLVYEPPTRVPQKGMVLLAYFTKTGSTEVRANSANAIIVDTGMISYLDGQKFKSFSYYVMLCSEVLGDRHQGIGDVLFLIHDGLESVEDVLPLAYVRVVTMFGHFTGTIEGEPWYSAYGEAPTAGKLGAKFERRTLERVKESMPNSNSF